MSADNWAICPKCKLMDELKKAAESQKASDAYGKVHAEEYERLIAIAREPIQYQDTLRENYDFNMSESGKFTASYSGFCERCGFKHSFRHEEQVEIK